VATEERYTAACEIFGSILPVRKIGDKMIWHMPWDNLIRWWGMQEAMVGIARWLSLPAKRLIVSLDWVDIRSFPCLMLAAWQKGRALPLLWQVLRWEELAKSQNDLEYGLLHLLRAALPVAGNDPARTPSRPDRGIGGGKLGMSQAVLPLPGCRESRIIRRYETETPKFR